MLLVVLSRYRRCPSDKVMVIYGQVGTNGSDGTLPGPPGVFTGARPSCGR